MKINCDYCNKEIEQKHRRHRFCSDKCKVYWHRKNSRTAILDIPFQMSTKCNGEWTQRREIKIVTKDKGKTFEVTCNRCDTKSEFRTKDYMNKSYSCPGCNCKILSIGKQ